MRINETITQAQAPCDQSSGASRKSSLSKSLAHAEQTPTTLKQMRAQSTGHKQKCISKLLATPIKSINMQNPPVMHTMEYQGVLLHDTNFNNKQKAKDESFTALCIINNPGICAKTIETISSKLFELISNSNKSGGKSECKLLEFIEKDTGNIEQFGQVKNGISGILSALKSETNSITFIQKMLIIKSFGAFIIDHASKSPADYNFLPINENINALIEKNRPSALFEVRGRTEVISKEYREDIGILDKKEFDLLSQEEKNALIIPGLHKVRPIFRTFTHEIGEDKKRNIESIFVNRTFNNDAPLVASISGSTSCILVGADLLVPGMLTNEKKEIAIAAVGFLVGGGYHSATEVLDVAYPGLDLKQELNFRKLRQAALSAQ
ncbi:hypothetical protein V8U11_06230 [Pseudomonas chlororaphis]|uniref:hypothetical protein n=1 Tax=Pseudomonas chlororaphis TaxID=587753 RepID=UPI0030D42181